MKSGVDLKNEIHEVCGKNVADTSTADAGIFYNPWVLVFFCLIALLLGHKGNRKQPYDEL